VLVRPGDLQPPDPPERAQDEGDLDEENATFRPPVLVSSHVLSEHR
jgi:hypothetical protein